MKKVQSILIIYFFVFAGTAVAQDDPMKGPWQESITAEFEQERASEPANAAAFLVKLYRRYISPIDGSDCPMYPCCSSYSIECFEKHGFFIGWIMTWDRLCRCGRDELRLSPWILFNGQLKCYDPVKNNDFWWYRLQDNDFGKAIDFHILNFTRPEGGGCIVIRRRPITL